MSEDLNRLPLSKKGQRQVTPFTGNGLLYDYMSSILDEERKQAVEIYLETSKEAQLDYQKIQTGLQYTAKLKQVTVSQALQDRLAAPSSYLSVLFKKSRFDQWPVGLKWGLEALVVVFVIVTFLTVAPWEKIMKLHLSMDTSDVVLSEVNKSSEAKKDIQVAAQAGPMETPQFIDEGLKATSKETAKEAAPLPTQVVPATAAKATPKPLPEENTETGSKANTGYLYRGQIAVTNLEAVGPKIKEKILELGGRKAGDVELGWQKTPGIAYFHFTIPEAKYDELQAFLSEYGKAKISKDKHPRIMPDGIVRLIINVEEAKK